MDSDDLEVMDSGQLTLDPDSVLRAANVVLPPLSAAERASRYYWARFIPAQGAPVQRQWSAVQATTFLSSDWGHLKLAPGDVSYELSELGGDVYRLTLTAEHFTWGLWLQHPESVRPSDNFLTLLPGVPYDIAVSGPAEAVESMTLTSLNDWLS
ncbi:MAG: glycoside hydrolase family 2 protein [Anaerolineae bacterium]